MAELSPAAQAIVMLLTAEPNDHIRRRIRRRILRIAAELRAHALPVPATTPAGQELQP